MMPALTCNSSNFLTAASVVPAGDVTFLRNSAALSVDLSNKELEPNNVYVANVRA